MTQYHTIILFPKLQPDTLLALFLLKRFGEAKFPGVKEAQVEFWTKLPEGKKAEELEKDGYILIDIGESIFDHHRQREGEKVSQCVSEIVAAYLGVQDEPALKKILAYAKRDDLEGKGTLSEDPLDRAFGLSGIIMNLNKYYQEDLKAAARIVLQIFEAHYREEEKRTKLMPEEWKKLKKEKTTREWVCSRGKHNVRVILVHTDNTSLPGFLRAYIHADLVIVRLSSGHVNIITNQAKTFDLRGLIEKIRKAEAAKKGTTLDFSEEEWQKPGFLSGVPEWFYDTAATTLQNGGVNPQNVPATQLSDDDFQEMLS